MGPQERSTDRLTAADHAITVVREVAEAHGAWHIFKRIGVVRSNHVNNARRRFARDMTDEETPLLLVDSSFLKNGKSGLLLTSRAVYSTRLHPPASFAEIESVVHRPPDHTLAIVEFIAIIAHVVFPPLILLSIPLIIRNRDRRKNALVINGRVAYLGDKNLSWGFWVDALQALAAEAHCRDADTRVAMMEVLTSDHAEPLRTAVPSSKTIEGVLGSLNGTTLRAVRLWAGTPRQSPGLEVLGGNGRYVLREVSGSWAYFDADAGDEEVEVCHGEQFPASHVCTGLDRVIAIVRSFSQTGAFD